MIKSMSTICPVCNGLTQFLAACPDCHRWLDDAGRVADYFGDYSPYQDIDIAKRTNGYLDLSNHLCLHAGWCPDCRTERIIAVHEIIFSSVR